MHKLLLGVTIALCLAGCVSDQGPTPEQFAQAVKDGRMTDAQVRQYYEGQIGALDGAIASNEAAQGAMPSGPPAMTCMPVGGYGVQTWASCR